MKLSEKAKSDNSKANVIWRFYSDSAHEWHWERLAFDGTALETSLLNYNNYEDCLANATECGYVLLPSLTTKPEKASPKTKRTYMRFTGRK